MLDALCGSQSVQKILLFLFVNGQSYGSQLQSCLQMALSPIQKALQRLERGGILCSFFEGKTRIYRFNPAYPLLEELESLLKKAYTLLPPAEKRLYYFSRSNQETISANQVDILLKFWRRLSSISQLACSAKNRSTEHSWSGKGRGEVTVTKEGDTILIFHEKGSWLNKDGGDLSFSNSYRWTLDRLGGVIALEHLRRGIDHAVFLFHLAPSGPHSLSSVDSHLCGGDSYFGRISFDQHSLRLHWRVIGPKKNAEIDNFYC